MDRHLTDEQLDRALVRILAEQGAEIEASGIPPATAAARVRLGSRTPPGLTYRPATPSEGGVGIHRPTLRTRFLTMNALLKLAAVAVLTLAVGIGVVQLRPSTDQIGTAPAPSPSPSPLVWSPASIEQDWPAPVRDEPVGDPVVIPITDGYLDPRGDIESPDMPWIDILHVGASRRNGASLHVASGAASGLVVPSDPWIAYGLVFDLDLDGVADVRLGLDRVPAELTPWRGDREPGDTTIRAWRTDLRTGVTEYGHAGVTICDCLWPEDGDESVRRAKFHPHNSGTPYRFGEIPGRIYVWASVIQDGRVVATDYAPDVGWLEPDQAVQAAVPGESPLP
jgi:hypothetical protein